MYFHIHCDANLFLHTDVHKLVLFFIIFIYLNCSIYSRLLSVDQLSKNKISRLLYSCDKIDGIDFGNLFSQLWFKIHTLINGSLSFHFMMLLLRFKTLFILIFNNSH